MRSASARGKNITAGGPSDFVLVTRKRVTGKFVGRLVAHGNAKLMADQTVDMGKLAAKADGLRGSSATALFVALDDKSDGIIAIADPIKPATQAALDSLGSDSIHVVMLTPGSRVEVHVIPTDEEARSPGIRTK